MSARMPERNPQSPISLETLRSSFYDEKVQKNEISSMAHDMQHQLGRYFNTKFSLAPCRLDDMKFDDLYDPTLPTIIIDSEHTFSGSELLGLVSHEDDTRANVIFAPTVTNSMSIKKNFVSDETRLEITSGAIVLPSGQVAYGDFPKPIIADAFETVDMHLIEQFEENNIPLFHSSESMRHFNNKGLLETLSNNDHTYTPRRIARTAFLNLETTDNLVIKPSKHSQGRGVLLTDQAADAEHTKRFYQFLEDNKYEPVVEERARSWEILDPVTKERLDWNVRAILSYGDLIDMYVRADAWGGPVNMSVSAQAIRMDEFTNYFENPHDAWKVMRILHDSAQAVAEENPASFIGVDLTVDENMQACLFEINGGNAGGLQTIAKLEQTYDDKLSMSRKVLAKFIDNTHMSAREIANSENTQTITPRPSFNAIARTAYVGELNSALRNLDIDEVPDTEEERYGSVLALVAIRTSIQRQLFDYSAHQKSGERLKEQYPLEFRRYLPHVYAGALTSISRKDLSSYIDDYSEIFRDDPQTLSLRARVAASEFNLRTYKDVYHQYVDRFKDDAEFLYGDTRAGFVERFQSLGSSLNEEEEVTFNQILDGAMTAYCEYGFEEADKIIARSLERQGANNSLSRMAHGLEFCMAYGDERYDDATRYFYACEEDFEEPWIFYEHIVDELISTARTDLDRQSAERLAFTTKLEMLTGRALVVTADMIDYLRSSDRDDTTRMSIVRTIAEHTPLEYTDEEQENFVATIMQVAKKPIGENQYVESLPVLAGMSNYAKYTLLIKKIFTGDHETANILIEQLKEVKEIGNDLYYLKDVYIDDPQGWGK